MSDEPRWRRYLRFRGPDIDADIDDEIRFHLEMRERDFLVAGKTPEQARDAARQHFGEVREVREWLRNHDRKRYRRVERTVLLEGLVQDIRYGLRKLRQQPEFTAALVMVLALGIGATTAIFSAVDAVLLRPLPFVEDSRLTRIEGIGVPYDIPGEPQSGPDITDLAARAAVFSDVAAYASGGMNLSGGALPARVRIAMVTPNFFTTLGVTPALGRAIAPEEGRRAGERVAILSDALWRRHFGADRAALGGEISLDGVSYRVVGVMPVGFGFPSRSELWVPMKLPRTFADLEPFGYIIETTVVGRLAPGVTVQQAGEWVQALLAEHPAPESSTNQGAPDLVHSLRETLVGDRSAAILVLFAATGLVLLVACANAATLLLSRAAARRREIAMRMMLGATAGRVVRQLLVESILLACLGGGLGILGARLGLRALDPLVPSAMAGAVALQVDGRVLLFTLGAVLVTGIGFGLWPAVAALRTRAWEVLRMGGTGGLTGETSHLRRGLVVAQLTLALVLLIGAAVMLRSFRELLSTDSGVEPERVATVELSLARAAYESAAERQLFMREVLERLDAYTRLEAAAIVDELPLRGQAPMRFAVVAEGLPEESVFAQRVLITPDYFRVLGIPLLRGRTYSDGSESPDGPAEVVVNRELARTLWPGADALGKRLLLPGIRTPFDVVGIVGDVSVERLGDQAIPQMYLPLLRNGARDVTLVVRGAASGPQLGNWLREAVHSVAPDQAVHSARTMKELISATIAPRRTSTVLITLFGALAVVLAAVGVYGVIAYGVARRKREIGIRIALGARPGQVVRRMMREGLVLASLGTGLGLLGAWMLTRALGGLVYGVSARDPIAFAAAPAALFAIALLASYLPARGAASVDPAQVLKSD